MSRRKPMAPAPSAVDPLPAEPAGWRWFGAIALLAACAWSAAVRIAVPLHDPNFAGRSAQALLRTDPAFLYYVTERIVQNGGAFPADLRADPLPEWPHSTDIAAVETVGQELFVAWTYLAFGQPMPLHLWSLWVMGLWSGLIAVGVFGMARELTGRLRWAGVAALLWAAMLGNYRTLGVVLIREDFAFPWIALHLWLALRAARLRTWTAFALAGATALAAAATWHASVFVLSIEALCFLAWFLRSGENPLGSPRALLGVAIVVAGSLALPVLRGKQFALSPPMLIAYGLLAAAFVARRFALGRAASAGVALGATALAFGASKALSAVLGGGLGDYGHVFALVLAKIEHLGRMPRDPRGLDFGARLLWQGPFRTAEASTFVPLLAAGSLAAVMGALVLGPAWLRGRGDGRPAVLLAYVLVAAFTTWLVERTAPLFGLVSPVLLVVLLDRLRSARLATGLALAAIAFQGADQVRLLRAQPLYWYTIPPSVDEREHLMAWLREHVPPGKPIAADYSTSAAILAHTRHPVLNQPKYETRRSRDLIEEFCRAYYQGTPRELRAYLLERRCRWLVVDRPFLGGNATDLGGLLPEDLARYRDRACWLTMSNDPAEYTRVPGFALVYESPPELQNRSCRVYRVE